MGLGEQWPREALAKPARGLTFDRANQAAGGCTPSESGSHLTLRWRELDSNPWSPVDGELGAPGPRATRAARHRETPERRSFASTSSASDLRHTWGAFHMDKAGLEIEIGDFEHLAASLFAFSATFEICRDDTICRQGSCQKRTTAGFPDHSEKL